MSRILIGTVPIGGHVAPMLPLARGLLARGHEVVWYSGEKYRAKIEATGVRFVGRTHAKDFDDASFDAIPERAALSGVDQLKYDLKHVFLDDSPGQLADLRAIARDFAPDLAIGDPCMIGGLYLQELEGIPIAILGVLPMSIGGVDVAPYGLGMQPSSSAFGRLRNRTLRSFVQGVVFGDVHRYWTATRAKVGLPETCFLMEAPRKAALLLQPTVPGFEYPRSDLPSNVRFVGMMPADPPKAVERPSWWADLDGGKPIVHVTQGTIANAAPELIAPALEGLASEDVLVVVSTGGRPIESLGLGELPRNARIATFLSYPELLPKTAAMVTNGGYGGVQIALSHGVPLVVAGTTEDKPEVGARVAWSGAGLDLKSSRPSPGAVRAAVRRLLDEPGFRRRAEALAAEHARYDAVPRAIEAIEETIAARDGERLSDAAE